MRTVIDTAAQSTIRVSDEVWIGTALLHREHPEREDFTVQEIVQRVAKENAAGGLRPGVSVHTYLHCVANRAPNPSGYRMLYATDKSARRLYRPTDPSHPERRGKMKPRRNQIPENYGYLLDWYEREYCQSNVGREPDLDPILALRGAGKEIWQGEDPDEYVRRLREGWE